jgi:hypothetical protein
MSLFAAPAMGSIFKKPPEKPKEQAYEELECTEADQKIIYEIITTMAESSKLSLLFKQTAMRELGSQINHVHGLKFLGTIFANPDLKIAMKSVWIDYFKKNGFLDGLGPSLTRESEKGKLDQYIPGFAAHVGQKPEVLRPYFKARDWEGLTHQLIYGD